MSGLWTMSSQVPMDIMMPDGSTRIPTIQRNAGARQFKTPAELNAFITATNASGGINGVKLPLVSDTARFSDGFSSIDLRVSRPLTLGGARIEPMIEVFNLLNTENILGTTNTNYSGFANVLVRDSEDPANARLPEVEPVRHAGDDRRWRVRLRRAARDAAGGASDVLGIRNQGSGITNQESGTRNHESQLTTYNSQIEVTNTRLLGPWGATAMIVAEVVGVGIFLTPAAMMRALGTHRTRAGALGRHGRADVCRRALLRRARRRVFLALAAPTSTSKKRSADVAPSSTAGCRCS